MQRWQEEFSNHPLFQILNQIEASLAKEAPAKDSRSEIEKNRLHKVVLFIRSTLEGLDAALAPTEMMSNVFHHLKNSGVINQLESFASSGDINQLVSANNNLSQVLSFAYQFRLREKSKLNNIDLRAATESFERYSRLVDESVNGAIALSMKASDSAKEALDISQRTADVTIKTQKMFDDQVNIWKSEFTNMQNEQRTEFTNAENSRNTTFNQTVESFKKQIIVKSEAISKSQQAEASKSQEIFHKLLDDIVVDAQKTKRYTNLV